jgi:diguanylate cyclase (GGDEF)-like protein/PAS domain S-box-containing protein
MNSNLMNSSPQNPLAPSALPQNATTLRTGEQLNNLSSLLQSLDGSSLPSPAAQANENRLIQVRLGVASGLYAALRSKHAASANHSLRVALGCSSWATALAMPEEDRDIIEVAALVHDVGKISVPDSVLLKPGKLTGEEIRIMEQQRMRGLEILSVCCANQGVLDAVRYAAAWFDGRTGLDKVAEQIPVAARMLSIVDAYDAMVTDHVYRRAMSRDRAMAELFENAGSQFDPRLVKNFCELLSKDQVSLGKDVARRWLKDLSPDASASFWQQGAMRVESQNDISSLFHDRLIDTMHDAVIFVDPRCRVLVWNRAAERLTGMSEASLTEKQWTPSLVGLHDEKEFEISDSDDPVMTAMESGTQIVRRLALRGRNQQMLSIDAQITPVLDNEGTCHGATVVMHDASSRTTLEERVQTLHVKATRDPLTKVANRAEFDRVHEEFVQAHLESGVPCSLIICDLDHFKKINDNFGHQAGDEALISFAALMRRFSRAGDLVARYGGEEFVLLCAETDNATATSRADEIRRELASLPQECLNGKCLTASFGVTEVQDGDTPETMLRRSDRALLQAKDQGRNCVVQLGSGMNNEKSTASGSGWLSWLTGGTTLDQVLEQTLETAVPLKVTAEKLRGFVADHHAEIVKIENDSIILNMHGTQNTNRRSSDRSMGFRIELELVEAEIQPAGHTQLTSGTQIFVVIRPLRHRDRRRENLADRARQILVSLKSYLVARESGAKR